MEQTLEVRTSDRVSQLESRARNGSLTIADRHGYLLPTVASQIYFLFFVFDDRTPSVVYIFKFCLLNRSVYIFDRYNAARNLRIRGNCFANNEKGKEKRFGHKSCSANRRYKIPRDPKLGKRKGISPKLKLGARYSIKNAEEWILLHNGVEAFHDYFCH